VIAAIWAIWMLGRILQAIQEQTAMLRNQPVPEVPGLADKLDSLDYELRTIREDLSAIRYAVENRDV
jgi:hypothetical protein